MTRADPTQTDLKSALEELRASVAEEGTRNGLAGMLQQAFLKILEVLMAMLMDFRAGRLAPLVATAAEDPGAGYAEDAEDAPRAAGGEPGKPAGSTPASGCRGWWPAWFQRHGWVPAFAGMTDETITFAGMTRKIEECRVPADGSAQFDCGSYSPNDAKNGSGGHAASPPLEGSSARQSGDDGADAAGAAGGPARFARLGREAERRADGAGNGLPPEVGGAREPDELGVFPRTLANVPRSAFHLRDEWSDSNSNHPVLTWRFGRDGGMREAFAALFRPAAGMATASVGSFLKKRAWAREGRRDDIVPA